LFSGTVISTSDGIVQHHMTSKQTNAVLDQHVQEINALAHESDKVVNHMGLEVGSMVEVPMTNNRSQFGVIRWLGRLPELKDRLVAGLELVRKFCIFFNVITGFVQVLENLESHGILFFSFPGLESHGILCRVMESHGKLNHYKKNYESIFIVYNDRQKFC